MVKKKLLVMLMTLCVVVTSIVGCSQTEQSETSSSNDSQSEEIETKVAGAETEVETEEKGEKEVISILMEPDPLVEDYETNLLTQMIEEEFNVDLEFVYLPTTNASDKLELMLNSGEKLPDIINKGMSLDQTTKYGTMGVLLPLEDYIENISVNVKRYDEMYADYKILDSVTSYDGHIYTIPFQANGHISNELRYKYWINQDWLEALNLEMPTTTEEFYNVLKAFKEGDPNGNGEADEIPLVGSKDWSSNVNIFLINAFGFTTDGEMLFNKDGKLDVSYTQDYYRDALTYIRRLTEEGLLDTTSYTNDYNQLKALINSEGNAIVGCYAFSANDIVTEEDRKLSYVGLAPLTGPDGYHGSSVVLQETTPKWYVTADAENPELAFLIGDYLFDEEKLTIERHGVQGVNWEYTDDTMVGAYEAFGFPSSYYILESIWTVNQNVHWRLGHPAISIKMQYGDIYYTEEECAEDISKAASNLLSDAIGIYQNDRPDASLNVASLSLTAEEVDVVSVIKADLKTFVAEQAVLFATGERDLATWDQYLEELEGIGLSTYLEIYQNAYDRVNAK